MGTWIDFKKLREDLDFAAVLSHFGVSLKANAAGQHHGRCPLPNHPKESTSLSFSVNLKKKVFRCFSCGAGGNCLDFAILMSGGNPENAADVRKTALMLVERFGLQQLPQEAPKPAPARSATRGTPSPSGRMQLPPPRVPQRSDMRGGVEPVRTEINAPLDFALKNLDGACAFLNKKGLLKPTIDHFGIGLCTKGTFAGRIAVPLYNIEGKLVGYTGLITDLFEESEDVPRYLWPNPREHNGVRHVLDRTKLLYHAHAVKGLVTDLYIVQAPESAWWLWQCGFQNVVAVMGDAPSSEQAQMMINSVSPTGRVWLLTDGTKSGDRCAQELFFDLGPHRFCTWVKLREGRPDEYEALDIQGMLEWNV
jgi:DNA primase